MLAVAAITGMRIPPPDNPARGRPRYRCRLCNATPAPRFLVRHGPSPERARSSRQKRAFFSGATMHTYADGLQILLLNEARGATE